MTRLSDTPVGTSIQIVGFSQDWNDKFRVRLTELGFGIGQEVHCVRKTPLKGPMVFKTGDTLYSLGRDVTDFILVEASCL